MLRGLAHAVEDTLSVVIVGLVPAIQRTSQKIQEGWILGTRPRMTQVGVEGP